MYFLFSISHHINLYKENVFFWEMVADEGVKFDYLWSDKGIGLDVVYPKGLAVLPTSGKVERACLQAGVDLAEAGLSGKFRTIYLPPVVTEVMEVPRLRVHPKNTLGLEAGTYFGQEEIKRYLERNAEILRRAG